LKRFSGGFCKAKAFYFVRKESPFPDRRNKKNKKRGKDGKKGERNVEKEIILTYEGLEKLEKELEYLKGEKRLEVAEKIKQALAFGDLSENSEYDAAKNEQAQVEERIVKITNMLKNAKVIDEDEVGTDIVSVGTKVKLLDVEFDEEIEYTIVGSTEADPSVGRISNESPVGQGLLGRKAGETVEIEVPQGTIVFKILSIAK
jgi:transcription elongation factor greA